MPILSLTQANDLVSAAFAFCGATPSNAASAARALVRAEADGQYGHGLIRTPIYAAQLKSGKINGRAAPRVVQRMPAAVRIDACNGFSFPALALAKRELTPLTQQQGIAAALLFNSGHFGQAGAVVEALAETGLAALLFGNTPKAMALWGADKPFLGTNPIAFAAPAPDGPPIVIDLALSTVARGKILAAKEIGAPIPEGWAFDATGAPTRDAAAAMEGSLAPLGAAGGQAGQNSGAKGVALALVVEILAAALTGGMFGFEAPSHFDEAGPPPGLGQLIIAFDPGKLSGEAYFHRMSALLTAAAGESGARLPGTQRLANRRKAEEEGLRLDKALHQQILALTEKYK